MRLRNRLLVLPLILALAGLLSLAGMSAPAEAATKNAGIPGLTPYGGYLGNYLAPDGSRVYCIDSPLPWPSGVTSGPSTVDTLATTWGSTLSASSLRRLNYVLSTYGQTDDPVQAAAVAAFVNAYTSGWARDLGAGHAAGVWYLNGNSTVTGVYDTIWADAEVHTDPVGSAAVHLDMTTSTEGALTVTATPGDASGVVTLEGAVRADTGESSFAVSASERIPVRGLPADDAREYTVSASAAFRAADASAPTLVLYTTPDQQRTIRGGGPGSFGFSANDRTGALHLEFTPVLTTAVESASTEVGQPLVDRVTVAADGSAPWRTLADGTLVPIVADGVLYGPFDDAPAESGAVPPGAPVAGTETFTLAGPGEYATSGTARASAPGYYTWVWSIDASRQEALGSAAVPADYRFTSPFGEARETHFVAQPSSRLASTGTAAGDSGAVAVGLLLLGVLLCASSRGYSPAGISRRKARWALRE